MLCLHFDTLDRIGQNLKRMLSILNELTLQKEWKQVMAKMCFGLKSKNTTTKSQQIKSLPEPGIEPATSRTAL